jgi:hypothetical protein
MQERYFANNPELERRYSVALLDQARQRAKEMIERGESVASLPIGEQSEAYFLSRRSSDVIGSQEIEVDGIKFFLGMKNAGEL